MTNKELDQKICKAFEEATPDVLGSVLADCKKQEKTVIKFKSNTAAWNKKFTFSAVAAILVIFLSIGLTSKHFGVGPTHPTDPFQTGTQPPTDYQPGAMDWVMRASLVQPDGTIVETYPMTIKGTIEEGNPHCYVKLDIELPKNFRYIFMIPEPNGDLDVEYPMKAPGDFTFAGYTYDREENAPAFAKWAINTEKEYFIAYWNDDFGSFLVGATDPDVKPTEIMEHFKPFIDIFGPTDPEPTDPEPTEPHPTEPTIPEGFPVDLNTDSDTIAAFQEMFGYMTWPAQALGQYYNDPKDLVLRNFFYGVGFKDEPTLTGDERTAIVAMTEIDDYAWMEGKRFPVEKMNKLLGEMFGISLDDMDKDVFSGMHYLERTDSYYYFNSGSKTTDLVTVVGTRTLENGNIEVYYLLGHPDNVDRDRAVVTLKPNGDGYLFLSNAAL